jgi:hypothetical protein
MHFRQSATSVVSASLGITLGWNKASTFLQNGDAKCNFAAFIWSERQRNIETCGLQRYSQAWCGPKKAGLRNLRARF